MGFTATPAQQQQTVECKKLLTTALTTKAAESQEAAQKLASSLKDANLNLAKFAEESKLSESLLASLTTKGKSKAGERAGALNVMAQIIAAYPQASQPFFTPFVTNMLDLHGDKARDVATLAKSTFEAFIAVFNPNATSLLMPQLIKTCSNWKADEVRLRLIGTWCDDYPSEMGSVIAESLPVVGKDIHQLKKQVSTAATAAVEAMCRCCSNTDLEPFFPALVESLTDHKTVPDCIFKLASTTFIKPVDLASLAIIAPLLEAGLKATRPDVVKRQCARIVENMVKLIDEPRDAMSFHAKLMPRLKAAEAGVADPEARNVCSVACTVLQRKADAVTRAAFDKAAVVGLLETAGATGLSSTVLEFAAENMVTLNNLQNHEEKAWMPIAAFLQDAAAEEIVKKTLEAVIAGQAEKEVEEEATAEQLCNCNFGLAYGNKVLLSNTVLKLNRGYRYGLVGQNDSGKTSLLKAVADQRVDGFPEGDQLRTVFVATDIQGELSELTVLDYMFADSLLQKSGVTRDTMATMLRSVGFNDESPANITTPVAALSGGWRMKLALARAMLLQADILLLDEPTNHLDSYNVKWVEDYLTSLDRVTSIIVSHDSGLLDRVCTNIIQIEDLKLKYFTGNLSAFVKICPEAKAYFELKSTKLQFSFPKPGVLSGIKSKGKAIMKMKNVSFTYPGAPKPQLNNVTVQVCLASRVACVGVNGAGKSTMVKLLTGELQPDDNKADEAEPTVWKHPNCRVAYVAQHAFHHIENHLDMTCNEYIRWRYTGGIDREELVKVTAIVTEAEEKLMASPMKVDMPHINDEGEQVFKVEKHVFKRFTLLRKENRTKGQEYEVEFKTSEKNCYVPRKVLVEHGFEKTLKQVDERIASREAQHARPLTKKNVAAHMAAVGLSEEFSTHIRIASLSGGQKVKVVLGAALWNCPHVLILDEPTNYLDRESLGALAGAIREFEGGVVMITHNSQFCNSLCPEVWSVANNTLDVQGDASWMKDALASKIETKQFKQEAMVDRFGNTVELKKSKKKLTRKEIRAKQARRRKRIKNGEGDFSSDSDDE